MFNRLRVRPDGEQRAELAARGHHEFHAFRTKFVSPDVAAFTLLGASFTLQFALIGLGVLVSGVGASAIHPVGYPLVATNVSADRVGSAYGIRGSAAKIGDAAAPISIAILIFVVQWSDI